MAIWPFGRKSKRHTLDLGALETPAVVPHPSDPEFPPPDHHHHTDNHTHHTHNGNAGGDAKLTRKPSRKRSKRQKKRHLQCTEEFSGPVRDPVSRSQLPHSSEEVHHASSSLRDNTSDNNNNNNNNNNNDHRFNNNNITSNNHSRASCLSVNQDQSSFSRPPSLFKDKRSGRGPGMMRTKSIKRKANDREREIRLMASAPIDIPKPCSRRSDKVRSDVSLSIRDSTGSSLSDISETYTFKVNAFSAWTPRPIIRYVEPPRSSVVSRSQNPSAGSVRREKLAISDDNLHANKRIEGLADDLDAGAIRELLERDRRRKERKGVERHEARERSSKHRAECNRNGEGRTTVHDTTQNEFDDDFTEEVSRGRPGNNNNKSSEQRVSDTQKFPDIQAGSWLRGPSRDNETSGNASSESMHVVGSMDGGSSIQVSKLGTRPSLAFSQDTRMSLSTNSLSRSHMAQKINTPSTSQVFTQGSASDISKAMEPEQRLSEQRNKRMNSLSSLLRRGSSRLKRSYRERAQEQQHQHQQQQQRQPSSFSNPSSSESFFKVNTPSSSSGPLPQAAAPAKSFLRPGTFNRSQSKFKEHFGDEPFSPSDSLAQSTEGLKTIPDASALDEEESHLDSRDDINNSTRPQPVDIPAREGKPRGNGDTDTESVDTGWDDADVPLSQSLASIDSEGSWMSGRFLRRISQRRPNPLRQNTGRDTLEEEDHRGNFSQQRARDNGVVGHQESSSHSRLNNPSPKGKGPHENSSFAVSRRASSNVLGDDPADDAVDDTDDEEIYDRHPSPSDEGTWHDEVGKRPIVVSPPDRPKSTQVLLSRNMQEGESS